MGGEEPTMLGRNVLRRFLALFFLPMGLMCLAYPLVELALGDEAGLIDDSRAWLGAGSGEGVPKVSEVSCTHQRYGTPSPSRHSFGYSNWDCILRLSLAAEARADERFAAGSANPALPSELERVLPSDRTGDLPVLRRLPDDGELVRFGVVWNGGELTRRWLHWLYLSALFFAFGAANLYAVRKALKG